MDPIARCKFRVTEIAQLVGPTWRIKMAPVYSADPESENRRFWDATPSGQFEIATNRPVGVELGKEYYLDLTPAG